MRRLSRAGVCRFHVGNKKSQRYFAGVTTGKAEGDGVSHLRETSPTDPLLSEEQSVVRPGRSPDSRDQVPHTVALPWRHLTAFPILPPTVMSKGHQAGRIFSCPDGDGRYRSRAERSMGRAKSPTSGISISRDLQALSALLLPGQRLSVGESEERSGGSSPCS